MRCSGPADSPLWSKRGAPLKRTAVLVAAVLTACSPAPVSKPDTDLVARIDSVAKLSLSVDPTPGLSVAVVRGPDTIMMKGYGLADVERDVAATSQTVFAIGSVTKQFTAAAVVKLVEERRLRLDATLGEILPEYEGPGRAATIHQLLNHTSGIPDYIRPGSRFWELRHERLTHEQILQLFASEPLQFRPGSRFAYSNAGYYLLGRVIERVTGRPYADHLAEALFRPLGLDHTGYCREDDLRPDRARGYGVARGKAALNTEDRFDNAFAAGALCSSAPDLVRWAQALAGGEVVSPGSFEQMVSPTATDNGQVPYGYGLAVATLKGHASIAHDGGFPGYRAALAHYPDSALTIAVLANGPFPAAHVQLRIAELVLGIEPNRYE